MNIDKIPLGLLTQSPGDDEYHLGTITISKGEYANAEKLNEIIDCIISIEERLNKVEGK